MSILILFVLLIFKLFLIIFSIWIVYSIYRTLRVYRIIIQVISSDMIIVLMFILICYLIKKLSLIFFLNLKFNFLIRGIVFFFFIIRILIEIIRLPYDFYERESELISGFSIELSSIIFIILILFEYLEIIYFIFILIVFFFNLNINLISYLILGIFIIFLIYRRRIFLRYRFDKILLLIWIFMFPLLILNFLSMSFIILV